MLKSMSFLLYEIEGKRAADLSSARSADLRLLPHPFPLTSAAVAIQASKLGVSLPPFFHVALSEF